jgi:hypothetical protein
MKMDEKGFLPRIAQRVEHFFMPVAYAHNMPVLTFSPSVVKQGETVTISGDGLKADANMMLPQRAADDHFIGHS